MPKDRTKRLFVGMTSIKGIFQELFIYKNMSRKRQMVTMSYLKKEKRFFFLDDYSATYNKDSSTLEQAW